LSCWFSSSCRKISFLADCLPCVLADSSLPDSLSCEPEGDNTCEYEGDGEDEGERDSSLLRFTALWPTSTPSFNPTILGLSARLSPLFHQGTPVSLTLISSFIFCFTCRSFLLAPPSAMKSCVNSAITHSFFLTCDQMRSAVILLIAETILPTNSPSFDIPTTE
uniref:Secreted protein n=1 Tax=Haemonchus placei TaxID=6290 RepID=A0A0N4VSL0_HAEPC